MTACIVERVQWIRGLNDRPARGEGRRLEDGLLDGLAYGYTRARCHSLLECVASIGILHINENAGGIMTEGPRLSWPVGRGAQPVPVVIIP